MDRYRTLCSDIDNFFRDMQNYGIETLDQIIETLDGSQEEKLCRKEFLNTLLISRKQVKTKIDEIRDRERKK